MEFKLFNEKLANNLANALERFKYLYTVDVDKDKLWNLYLDSFPAGTNELYRVRRKYDCGCCRQFIKNVGGTVYIDDGYNVHSIFEFNTGSDVFQPVVDALDAYVKSKFITGIYLNDSRKVGTELSRELLSNGDVHTYYHFNVKLPDQCVEQYYKIAARNSMFVSKAAVFKRSLDEISMEAIDDVLELIETDSLYRGDEWRRAIKSLKVFKEEYEAVPEEKRDFYVWKKTMFTDDAIARIRNHSIGVLLTDLSNGEDLEVAVKRYENIVAPTNYKRPKAVYTQRMLDQAKKTITELGYYDSLPRRFANLDDITVNNILFSNKDSAKKTAGDIFDDMKPAVKAKQFDRVEEVPVQTFVNDILPTATGLEVLLENRHASNMVSLIAPVNNEAPSMFKWNNAFSWAYAGNITDSDIRENVKLAGGKVDGVLRFSIQWNDGKEWNRNDLDAHCLETMAMGTHIFFNKRYSPYTGGNLDVDIRYPNQGRPAVENITYPSKDKMRPGEYTFAVHNYEHRGGRDGFRAEIEFDGHIYRYNFPHDIRTDEVIKVAVVTLDNKGNFSIRDILKSEEASRDIWGLASNTFVPVTAMMYSPNHWSNELGVGHKHYFFMLKGCVNPDTPNGFYNEFLKHELEGHKRVLEALGGKAAVEHTNDQLSGLGFSASKRNELIVKVKGASERVMKIKF
jgi:hypothetical protein